MTRTHRPLALITGGSAGLGRALVHALHDRGWTVVTDGRDAVRLAEATRDLDDVAALPGDVAEPHHRAELVRAVQDLDRGLDLLVHNASTLGPLPMGHLQDLETGSLAAIWDTNAGAPHALTRALVPDLRRGEGVILSLSSDAAVQHYEGWGGYGAAKAALEQLTRVLAEEHSELRVYAFDPGDMRTQMHQDAFPGEDISDRPPPDESVPALLALIEGELPSGRYRATDLGAAVR
jgi:NAD(P)-dependent dehydrogenase (short-subunit alcohol dehydrogenase family)